MSDARRAASLRQANDFSRSSSCKTSLALATVAVVATTSPVAGQMTGEEIILLPTVKVETSAPAAGPVSPKRRKPTAAAATPAAAAPAPVSAPAEPAAGSGGLSPYADPLWIPGSSGPQRKGESELSSALSPSCLRNSTDMLQMSKGKVLQHIGVTAHSDAQRSWSAPAANAARRSCGRSRARR